MNEVQLDELIEAYCKMCVDGMSYKEMGQMLFEMMVDSFSQYSEAEMIDTITTVYDEDILHQLYEGIGIDPDTV